MAEPSRTEANSKKALQQLGLPSPRRMSGLTPGQIDAYCVLAQCLDALSDKKPLNTFLSGRLPNAISTLQAIWPELMPAVGDAQSEPALPTQATAPAWLTSLKKCRVVVSAQPLPAHPSILLKYLFQVVELADLSILDNVSVEDVVPVLISSMQKSPLPASLLPEDKAILFFAAPKGKKRNALLRVNLVLESGQFFRLDDNPDMVVSRTAFFDSNGEPRGNFSQEDLQDNFLAPWPKTVSWADFMVGLERRCVDLTEKGLLDLPISLFGHYAGDLKAFLVDPSKLRASGFVKDLGELLSGQRESPLLNRVLAAPGESTLVRLTTARRDLFLGHMDERSSNGRSGYPLDPTQRLAAMTALAMDQHPAKLPILPVNGPPGTGKTSFLRAVLASTWVRAAYEKASHPPIVVGTGATNKAVSNVIDAFSTVSDLDGNGLERRWISGLPSYGWLFPSKDAQEKFPDLMHLVYSKVTNSPFTPDGGAAEFGEALLDDLARDYCAMAAASLNLSSETPWSPAAIVDELHRRIVQHVESLRAEQHTFAKRLKHLRDVWPSARGTAVPVVTSTHKLASLTLGQQSTERRAGELDAAISPARLAISLQTNLRSGFKGFIQSVFGDLFFKGEVADLAILSIKAGEAMKAIDGVWPDTLVERRQALSRLMQEKEQINSELVALDKLYRSTEDYLKPLKQARAARKEAFRVVSDMLYSPAALPPRELLNTKYLLRFLHSPNKDARLAFEDMLWHRFDACQDIKYRFPLFHLAARYWEGRWLVEQAAIAGKTLGDKERLQHLMMLGVIIVSTTHKLSTIGNSAAVDLLVVDESGQCGPEVGAVALSFAKSALLVGDTKQLQPIPAVTLAQSLHIAGGLKLELPPAFCAARGSAMAIARYVTPYTDGVDGNGITLLYHYRCHPKIIGYCNQLLYADQIRYVRPDKPTLANLPPMSWVDVPGLPEKDGKSWRNEHELSGIASWIRDNHKALCSAYGKPLDEVLAVIAPLRGQSEKAKTYLAEVLRDVIPSEVFKRITIGTVHALQGAERPVVAFSLVQHRSISPLLFADWDGGFLMNVAASRAKDAFIVFASRDTLRPAPNDRPLSADDETKPIGQLGAYLRRFGTRLYPRRLVVVEAPGKVDRIQAALGTASVVIATSGYLANSQLDRDGNLSWDAPTPEFVNRVMEHAGLLDELVVATDDDIAGELIGMQVAEVAADTLGTIPVRRMRFHSLDANHLRDSLTAAGTRFDADFLAAALLRATLQHLDHADFCSRLPNATYVSEPERALVDLVDKHAHENSERTVEVALVDEVGGRFVGYVPVNEAVLAARAVLSDTNAVVVADQLVNQSFPIIEQSSVARVAALYPPSTTLRILAIVANEHGMMPWETQAHLNAMYQAGAEVK